jgi:riboflavin synthase
MFSGIVASVGSVVGNSRHNDTRRLAVSCDFDPEEIAVGTSIACAGVCLTVVSRERTPGGDTVFEVDVGPETLGVTTASGWEVGTRINLERSLRLGDELAGHLVSGHVDGLATILEREDLGETTRFRFEAPDRLARLIATKGSVALDGTSLTVNSVDGARFDCLLIPHTLQVTTWKERKVGDSINLEVDLIARYVARLAETA